MDDATVIWDLDDEPEGNVQHILEHDITKEEVEEVLFNPENPTTESKSSGEPLTFGWTSTGRYIGVVWEHVLDNPLTIRPITAFDAPPPQETTIMKFKSVQKKIERTPEERARIQAIREKFQGEKPSMEQLLASGDYTEPVPLATYLETKELLHRLKREREQAGLSLADVADRTGMDKAAISRLENGRQQNPTVETLSRYAIAIGKQLIWAFTDLPARKKTPKVGKESPCDSENVAGGL